MIYGNGAVDQVYREQIDPMLEEVYQRLLTDAKAHDRNSVLYKHHIDYIRKLTQYNQSITVNYEETEPNMIVVDYIASMTDDYFIDLYNYLFPKGRHQVNYIGYFDDL